MEYMEYKEKFIKLFKRMQCKRVLPETRETFEECRSLFSRDYECRYINGASGSSETLPEFMVVPIAEKDPKEQRKIMNFDETQYLMQSDDPSPGGRFPCPVILVKGKYICRSRHPPILKYSPSDPDTKESGLLRMARLARTNQKYKFALTDANFLKSIGVTSICNFANHLDDCDFKKEITTSETLKNIYREVEISAMPYPNQDHFFQRRIDTEIDAEMYLTFLLEMLIEKEGGLLVQTFNGRNRAAFFTSLLRLSLWADGVIHKSLSMEEIAFLTLAYDWYLFGYCLTDNQSLTNEMLCLFIEILPSLTTDELSIMRLYENMPRYKRIPTKFPKFSPSRREILKELSDILKESLNVSKRKESVAESSRKM